MVPPIQNPCDFGDPEPCGANPSLKYPRYPCDFDDPRPAQDSLGLPVIQDLITPVIAEVANRNRESTLAIEYELGIQPSGTFTTVRARLDALEGLLCSIWTTINGSGSPIDIRWDNNLILQGVRTINFTGTAITSILDAGGLQANIQIDGGGSSGDCDGYEPVHEALAVNSIGQVNFTLSNTPLNNIVVFWVGGIKQEIGDYTVSGTSLTWTGSTELIPEDVVEVLYYKIVPGGGCGGGGGGSPISIYDEGILSESFVTSIDFVGAGVTAVGDGLGGVTVTVTGGGTVMRQDVFSPGGLSGIWMVSGTPINQQSTELFIDGVSQTVVTDYTVSGSVVTYSGNPPLTGAEEVVIKYLENVSIADGYINYDNVLSQALAGGSHDDVSIALDVSIVRFSAAAPATITGIDANGYARRLIIINVGSETITLAAEDAGSSAENRFVAASNITANQSVNLWYDNISQRWRVI